MEILANFPIDRERTSFGIKGGHVVTRLEIAKLSMPKPLRHPKTSLDDLLKEQAETFR